MSDKPECPRALLAKGRRGDKAALLRLDCYLTEAGHLACAAVVRATQLREVSRATKTHLWRLLTLVLRRGGGDAELQRLMEDPPRLDWVRRS